MSERYEFVDMGATGAGAVRTAFANQVAYCRSSEAPVTARIVAALAALLDKPATDFARRIASWEGAPLADALPLRAAGGLHALHLAGAASCLEAVLKLGEGDQLLDEPLGLLRAAKGRANVAVADELALKVHEQRVALIGGKPQLSVVDSMIHCPCRLGLTQSQSSKSSSSSMFKPS